MEAKLSKRAEKALAILKEGGEVAYKLERNGYTGREQFQARFYLKSGERALGFSFKVFYELRQFGLIKQYSYSSIGQYYRAA